MTEPVATLDHHRRAGINPRPVGFVDDLTTAHTHDSADAAHEAGLLIWADGSEAGQGQKIVTDAYPYRLLAWRMHNGFSIDPTFAPTRAFVAKSKRIETLVGYCVFKPGESTAILAALKNEFGSSPEFGIEPDMESGTQFAGPGNHSSEANDFVAALGQWANNPSQVYGYANSPDWSSCWPSPPKGMKRELAAYSSTLYASAGSQWFAQQVYGGMNYPTPAGAPRAIAPWGGWIDVNVASMTLQQFQIALGLRDDNTLKVDGMDITSDELNALIDKRAKAITEEEVAEFGHAVLLGAPRTGNWTHHNRPEMVPGSDTKGVYDRLNALDGKTIGAKDGQ